MTTQQGVMASIKHFLIRMLPIVVMLVVGIVFSAQLFGQNGNGLFSNKQNEQGSEQSGAIQTPIKGDLVEYVMYSENGNVYALDVIKGVKTLVNDYSENKLSHDDFKSEVIKSNTVRLADGGTTQNTTEQRLASERTGNSIVYDYGNNLEQLKVSVATKDKSVVLTDFVRGRNPETEIRRYPIGWENENELLISYGYESDHLVEGVYIYNVNTEKEKMILPAESYVNVPRLSPSGRYLIYDVVIGKYDTQHYDDTETWVYDLQTDKTWRIIGRNGYTLGWTTNEKLANKSADADFNLLTACSSHCLYSPNNLIFKLPFACGESYKVTRDGEGCTPSECNLGSGNFPVSTWTASSAPHGGKRAIDFADQSVGGTGSNQLPVLAAASGEVVLVGWENPNNQGAGYGKRIWLKHNDGTFTVYGHLSSFSVSANQQVTQGQQLGNEGNTGASTGEHIHFERRIASVPGGSSPSGTGADSYWMQFTETGAGNLPRDNYIYTSQNGSCSMSCNSVTSISACGGTLSNQTNNGGQNKRATYFVSMPSVGSGNAATQNESGPEKIYTIATTTSGTISVNLTNVSYLSGSDVDVFILKPSSCSNMEPLLHCKGTSSGVTATYSTASAGTYYIIVDGVNGAIANYTLSVTAPCSGGGLPNLAFYSGTASLSGSLMTYTINIQNNGTASAINPRFRLYLSTNSTYGASDVYLAGYVYSGTLPTGYYISGSDTKDLLNYVGPGTYYLIVVMDPLFEIAESNENDNEFASSNSFVLTSITVQNPPIPPLVSDYIVTEQVAVTGQTTSNENTLVAQNSNWLFKNQDGVYTGNFSSGEVVIITDMLGQQLAFIKVREDGELLLPEFPSGLYIITVTSGNENKILRSDKLVY